MGRYRLAAPLGALLVAVLAWEDIRTGRGAELRIEELQWLPTGEVVVATEGEADRYYLLERGSRVDQILNARAIAMGSTGRLSLIDREPPPEGAFYRLRAVSRNAPRDSDRDGMDDVYEWGQPGILDPLNPADALLDPDGDGVSHLAAYRTRFGFSDSPPPYLSREWSVYQAPPRFGRAVAYSREVSLYAGQRVATSSLGMVVSRELTTHGNREPRSIHAQSREWSIYTGAVIPPIPTRNPLSREFTVFQEQPSAALASRESSVFNHREALRAREVISRETSVLVDDSTDIAP